MHVCNTFFLKPPLGLPTTCGQDYIARALMPLNYAHNGLQPIVAEQEQDYIAQAGLHCHYSSTEC